MSTDDQTLNLAALPLDPGQMELFAAFVETTPAEYANVFELLDSVMIFSSERTRETPAPDTRTVNVRGFTAPIQVLLSPAAITEGGKTKFIMPGKREELVERAIRKLASENIHRLSVESEKEAVIGGAENKPSHIVVIFRLSQLRRVLRETGHDFKLSELREALTVLQRARMDFRKDLVSPANGTDPRLTRLTDGSTFIQRVQTIEDPKDKTGDRIFYKVTLNPLASAAILEKTYRLIDFPTMMRLKSDIARWLYVRMSNRYKQASHEAMYAKEAQYHISLATILNESGFKGCARMRQNLSVIEEALNEMKEQQVIENYTVRKDRGRVPGTRGPAQVVGAVWNIIPSAKFIDDAVKSNVRFRGKANGERR